MAFWNRKKNWEDEGLIGGLFVGAAGAISGVTMVEKLLTSLATPVGVTWIALMLLVYFSLLLKASWPALVGFFCWVVLTIGGNSFVANQLMLSLEKPYIGIKVLELESFDTLVLLGGGTKTNRNGRAQTSSDGSRRDFEISCRVR